MILVSEKGYITGVREGLCSWCQRRAMLLVSEKGYDLGVREGL